MGSEVIIVPAAFFMVGFVVYVIVEGFRRRSQVKMVTDLHSRLLDRMGSTKDFADFFVSDSGRRFMDSLATTETGAPQMRILRSVQLGLVLLALGVGLFILTDQRTFSLEAMDGLVVTATVTAAIGAGLIVSTLMTYLLSRQMGLLSRGSADKSLERRESV